MNKKVLITGVTGQDGSFLVDLLVSKKNYTIYGIANPISVTYPTYLQINKVILCDININDRNQIFNLISKIKPDEIYHLASNVEPRIIEFSEYSGFNNNFASGMNILDAIKILSPNTKLYLAGSSLMFGDTESNSQNELTPMSPNTPYGIAKYSLFQFLKMYRESYGLFCVCGILFNHESPRRSDKFLPRKITKAAARIKKGLQNYLELGNINIQRDWSYAGDIVESMWLMLNSSQPKDYVVGSGVLNSVNDILTISFEYLDLDWTNYVKTNESLFRPNEYRSLCADTSLINKEIGWCVTKSFKNMIEEMVDHDFKELENEN